MADKVLSVDAFDFQPGRKLAGKYVVDSLLGRGYEGEVYKVTETRTGISRAAKVFYPQRNLRDRAIRFYANKLDRLRDCPIVIQYHHAEVIQFRRRPVTCLISELVEGEILSAFIARQPGRRLHAFEALHVLYPLVVGLEKIHAAREYHCDIHTDNVILKRRGIFFDVKLVDFYNYGSPTAAKIREDVIMTVHVLYEALGGRAHYAKQPPEIKNICRGLRRDLISRKFPTAGHLRAWLDSFTWPNH